MPELCFPIQRVEEHGSDNGSAVQLYVGASKEVLVQQHVSLDLLCNCTGPCDSKVL